MPEAYENWAPGTGSICPTCGVEIDYDRTPFICRSGIMSPQHCKAALQQYRTGKGPKNMGDAIQLTDIKEMGLNPKMG